MSCRRIFESEYIFAYLENTVSFAKDCLEDYLNKKVLTISYKDGSAASEWKYLGLKISIQAIAHLPLP